MSKHVLNKRRKKPNATDLMALAQAGKIDLSHRTRLLPKTEVPGVSVTLIIKNCAEQLTRCIESLKKSFLLPHDEVICLDTGSTDNTAQVARKLGCVVLERADLKADMATKVKEWLPTYYEKYGGEQQFAGGCLMDFAAARQIVTDAAKYDTIFWIDSDDVFEERDPGATRKIIAEHMGKEIDSLFLTYLYSFDKHDQAPTTILKRERIVDRRKYVWRGKCHETLIPRDGATILGAGWFENLPTAIVHAHGRPDSQLSDIRNYVIIRSEIEADLAAGRQPDTRSVFYLGNAARGLRRHPEAIQMYEKTIELSGSRDDRFSAAYYIAITYLAPENKRPLEALDHAFRCLKLKPEDPRGYFTVARCYHLLARNEESLHWFECGRRLPEPQQTLHSYDPEHIRTLPYYIAISAAKELKNEEKVKEYAEYLSQYRPDHPDVKTILGDVQNFLAGQNLIRSVQSVCINMRPQGPKAQLDAARKVVELLPEIPDELENKGLGKLESFDPRDVRTATYTNEAGEQVTEIVRATLDDDLVFWCGHTLEPWGPQTDGIGGSEKAVIQMAPRMQKLGFNVTVYCNVPRAQRGIDANGVRWVHWSEFDHTRPRGTVIFWRAVGALESPWPIKKRIFWGHDVQRPEHWTDVRIAAADDIWYLSNYHPTTLGPELQKKMAPKIWITRNGIDSDLFKKALAENLPRKDNRVIYCSSPDRGLLTAIRAFQSAFADQPDAELHVAYGFNKNYRDLAAKQEYGAIPDVGRDMSYYDYMRLCFAEMDKDARITYHGRLTAGNLAKLMVTSKVWLYPTRFPEISCMSAMEAQAAGCHIVASDFAALAETINWDHAAVTQIKADVPDYTARMLRKASMEKYQGGLAQIAQDRFSYDSLALKWAARIRGVSVA